jgi:hypothetical protein
MTQGTPENPVYVKYLQQDNSATKLYTVHVNEGWRSWILGTDMYEHVADQLIERLAAHPKPWNY